MQNDALDIIRTDQHNTPAFKVILDGYVAQSVRAQHS